MHARRDKVGTAIRPEFKPVVQRTATLSGVQAVEEVARKAKAIAVIKGVDVAPADPLQPIRDRLASPSAGSWSERDTLDKAILPFLEALGWGLDDRRLEVSAGHRNDSIDVALQLGGTIAVVVEAKSLKAGFSEKDVPQLGTYMLLKQTRWGLLADGRYYTLYYLETGATRPDEMLKYDILKYPLNWIQDYLGKDRVSRDDAERLARARLFRSRMLSAVSKNRDDLAQTVAGWLRRQGGAKGRANREVADQLAMEIVDGFRQVAAAAGAPTGRDSPVGHSKAAPLQMPGEPARRVPTSKTRGKQGVERLLEAAEELIAEGSLDAGRCPVKVGKASKRFLVHTKPMHPNGRKFFNGKKLSNGLWIEAHASKKDNTRYAQMLREALRTPAAGPAPGETGGVGPFYHTRYLVNARRSVVGVGTTPGSRTEHRNATKYHDFLDVARAVATLVDNQPGSLFGTAQVKRALPAGAGGSRTSLNSRVRAVLGVLEAGSQTSWVNEKDGGNPVFSTKRTGQELMAWVEENIVPGATFGN